MTTFTTQDRLEAKIKELEAEIEALKAELQERFNAGKSLGFAEGISRAFGKGMEL